jgi:hypothetical protein
VMNQNTSESLPASGQQETETEGKCYVASYKNLLIQGFLLALVSFQSDECSHPRIRI